MSLRSFWYIYSVFDLAKFNIWIIKAVKLFAIYKATLKSVTLFMINLPLTHFKHEVKSEKRIVHKLCYIMCLECEISTIEKSSVRFWNV